MLSMDAYAEGVPCWIRCHCPPMIASGADVPVVLRSSVNPPLNCLARSTGILTTYLGKRMGIQGWRDYHLSARVNGTVIQAAGSTDGLYTIDLRILQLHVGDQAVVLPEHLVFIRIEVFPFVRGGAPLPVHAYDKVCISGKLMWDADGFLEIHPKNSKDILRRSCP